MGNIDVEAVALRRVLGTVMLRISRDMGKVSGEQTMRNVNLSYSQH